MDYNRVSGNVRSAVRYRSNSCNNDHRRVASPTDNIARDNVPRCVLRFRSIVASRYDVYTIYRNAAFIPDFPEFEIRV